MDQQNIKILRELSKDSRISIDKLADKVGLSATPVRRRVKDLEDKGVLKKYTIEVDMEKCGIGQLMYVYVKLQSRDSQTLASFESRILSLSEVAICNLVTGAFDYMLEVRTKDMATYNYFLRNVLAELPGVFGIETSVVISCLKRETALP